MKTYFTNILDELVSKYNFNLTKVPWRVDSREFMLSIIQVEDSPNIYKIIDTFYDDTIYRGKLRDIEDLENVLELVSYKMN